MNINMNLLGRIGRFSLFAALLAAFAVPASAQQLYTSGPVNGQNDAWTINYGFAVSDTFTLSSTATPAQLVFDVWTEESGDTLTNVDWLIGTGAGTSNIATETDVAVSQSFLSALSPNPYGYDLDQETLTLSGVGSLTAGTYWLTLQNAVVSNGDPIFWDENDGASSGWENSVGYFPGSETCYAPNYNCSETFTINGPASVTPEPATLSLLGTGLLFLLGLGRRRIV